MILVCEYVTNYPTADDYPELDATIVSLSVDAVLEGISAYRCL